jgi:hypothetical protein
MFALKCQGAVEVVTGGDRLSGENVAALAKVLDIPIERGQPQVVVDLQSIAVIRRNASGWAGRSSWPTQTRFAARC